jgi:ABC-2 type transport system ATP-binding protein
VGLAERGDDFVRRYSFGMRQRLAIAAALLGDPALLILDEPTNGLDPVGIHEMRELIGGMARADRTILVSSHVLSELQHVCDWLVVLHAGRVAFQGPAGDFLEADSRLVAAPEHERDLGRLGALIEARGLAVRREREELVVLLDHRDPGELAAEINRAAMGEEIVLAELHVVRPDLESRYLSLVGKEFS